MNIRFTTTEEQKAEVATKFKTYLSDRVNEPPYYLDWSSIVEQYCRYIPLDWKNIIQTFWCGFNAYNFLESEFKSINYVPFTPLFFTLQDKKEADEHPTQHVYVRVHPGQVYAGFGLSSKFSTLAKNMMYRRWNTGLSHLNPALEMMNKAVELGWISSEELLQQFNIMITNKLQNSGEFELKLITSINNGKKSKKL